jgi:hypothetical protein
MKLDEGKALLLKILEDEYISNLLRDTSTEVSEMEKCSRMVFKEFQKNFAIAKGSLRGSKKLFSELMAVQVPNLEDKYHQIVNWSNGQSYKKIPLLIFQSCCLWVTHVSMCLKISESSQKSAFACIQAKLAFEEESVDAITCHLDKRVDVAEYESAIERSTRDDRVLLLNFVHQDGEGGTKDALCSEHIEILLLALKQMSEKYQKFGEFVILNLYFTLVKDSLDTCRNSNCTIDLDTRHRLSR